MGNAEKEDIHKTIDEGIRKASTLMIWIFGVANTLVVLIIGGMTIPTYVQMWELKTEVSKKVNSDEAYLNFMTKTQYNIMEKNEHRYVIESILNPKSCHDIFRESDMFRADQLEIRYRGEN